MGTLVLLNVFWTIGLVVFKLMDYRNVKKIRSLIRQRHRQSIQRGNESYEKKLLSVSQYEVIMYQKLMDVAISLEDGAYELAAGCEPHEARIRNFLLRKGVVAHSVVEDLNKKYETLVGEPLVEFHRKNTKVVFDRNFYKGLSKN